MRFRIPQHIEVEDKVIGPLTLKQFVYLAGGGGALIAMFLTLPFFLTIVLGIPVAGLAAALAFYEVEGIPFADVLEAAVRYFTQEKLYIWKKEYQHPEGPSVAPPREDGGIPQRVPTVGDSKLKDLAWSLDVQQSNVLTEEDDEEHQRVDEIDLSE